MTVKIDGTNTVANPAFTGADTDTGLQCGTNELNLVTGGTERVKVDSSGNVGIGTTSPGSYLASAHQLVISDSASTGLTIATPTSSSGTIAFADGTGAADNARGLIRYGHSDNSLQFSTNAGERIRILSAGGLTFNGDTAAANALDDYEEGTFTPVDASPANLTYTSNTGVYTRIGDMVFCYTRFFVPSNTNGAQHKVTGFPFNSGKVNAFSGGYIHYSGSGIDLNYRRTGSNSFLATRDGGTTVVTNAMMSGDEVQALFIYSVG